RLEHGGNLRLRRGGRLDEQLAGRQQLDPALPRSRGVISGSRRALRRENVAERIRDLLSVLRREVVDGRVGGGGADDQQESQERQGMESHTFDPFEVTGRIYTRRRSSLPARREALRLRQPSRDARSCGAIRRTPRAPAPCATSRRASRGLPACPPR